MTHNGNNITLFIEAFLINLVHAPINLFQLREVIVKQLETVYQGEVGRFHLKCVALVQPLYKFNMKQLYEHTVIAVVKNVTHDNVAEAHFEGNLIKINVKHVQSLISGKNLRTLAHEAGHLLGLDHPHANAKYNSVNALASPHEQSMTENERQLNLMSQTWYIQKAGFAINACTKLTEGQIELLIENFTKKKLNKNYSIIRRFFGYKWINKM